VAEEVCKHDLNNSCLSIFNFGIGSGLMALEVLKRNRKVSILGVDILPEMIERARERLEFWQSQVSLICGDGCKLIRWVGDNKFDVFISGYALHIIPREDRLNLLNNIYRVLKPNGLFITADKIVSDDLQHYREDNQLRRIVIVGEFKNLLREAGFIDVKEIFHN